MSIRIFNINTFIQYQYVYSISIRIFNDVCAYVSDIYVKYIYRCMCAQYMRNESLHLHILYGIKYLLFTLFTGFSHRTTIMLEYQLERFSLSNRFVSLLFIPSVAFGQMIKLQEQSDTVIYSLNINIST